MQKSPTLDALAKANLKVGAVFFYSVERFQVFRNNELDHILLKITVLKFKHFFAKYLLQKREIISTSPILLNLD